MSTERTKLEQGRAAFAFKCAEEGARLEKKKEYLSYVRKIPMQIKTNGLGAAMAFAFAKGSKNGTPQKDKAWGLLYHHVEQWLKIDPKQLIQFNDNRLAAKLTEEKSATYRAVTIEVLAFLSWLKRFSEGLIDE
ncbi:MAG: type III-B CRISPR module-associated protein Cmr5 [Phaeodactylibacter sp.]|nr:type III-B CRISPR module-associated protein Cmr5 [Phaeodactylibacter sp.]